MEDHDEDPQGTDATPDEGTVPKSELKKAIAKRQEKAAKLAAAEARLAEYEAKEKEAEEKALRDSQNWQELEKRLSTERDQARAELEGFRTQTRRGALLDAVVKTTGADRTIVDALMLKASLDPQHKSLDWAPEDLNERGVEQIHKLLSKLAPSVFINKGNGAGGSSGVPGSNHHTKAPGETDDMSAKYRNMGKTHSDNAYGRK